MNNKTSSWHDVFGPNLGYLLEQYDLYVSDANRVDESLQELFAVWGEPPLEGVGYYCRFSLSYRDISEILNERGVLVHPIITMRWVHEYGNLIYQTWKKKNMHVHVSWKLDENYFKVKGK
jgi:putative transposase